jgi:hypothetical protein
MSENIQISPRLTLFTSPEILNRLDLRFLLQFLEMHRDSLTPEAAALLTKTPDLDILEYLRNWAAQFQQAEKFGAPLRHVLIAIEALASPDNLPLLNNAAYYNLPPGLEINHRVPVLQRALSLWLLSKGVISIKFPTIPGVPEPPPDVPKRIDSAVIPASSHPLVPVASPPIAVPEPAPPTPPLTAEPPASSPGAPAPAPTFLDHPCTSATLTSPLSSAPSAAKEDLSSVASEAEEDAATFLRLANLPPAEYDRIRQSEARRLGIRISTLEFEVNRVRTQLDVESNALNLPKVIPWPDPVHELSPVLSAISERNSLYLFLPDGAADTFALWSSHTHAYQAFHISPRLNLRSPAGGCGKTTTLDVLATFCACPLRTENLSAAVLFRLVAQYQPTLLLDEVDAYLPQSEELRGLLNSGHKRGACAMRIEGERKAVRGFKAFAPAALAGLGPLTGTLHDRSIVIPLQAAPNGAIKKRFDPLDLKIETELARKLARWSKDNLAVLAVCEPPLPPGVFNRLADNWRPLFAIAYLADADWLARAHAAYAKLTPTTPSTQSATEALLADIRQIFLDLNATRLFSKTLVDHLNTLRGARTFQSAATPEVHALSEATLARRLAQLGIYPRPLRIDGHRARGYDLADFPTPPTSEPHSDTPDTPQIPKT